MSDAASKLSSFPATRGATEALLTGAVPFYPIFQP